jgi:hypothetical protein
LALLWQALQVREPAFFGPVLVVNAVTVMKMTATAMKDTAVFIDTSLFYGVESRRVYLWTAEQRSVAFHFYCASPAEVPISLPVLILASMKNNANG